MIISGLVKYCAMKGIMKWILLQKKEKTFTNNMNSCWIHVNMPVNSRPICLMILPTRYSFQQNLHSHTVSSINLLVLFFIDYNSLFDHLFQFLICLKGQTRVLFIQKCFTRLISTLSISLRLLHVVITLSYGTTSL